MSDEKINCKPVWRCDTCGQEFEANLFWHNIDQKIYDKKTLEIHYRTKKCDGKLQRIV